MNFNSSRIFLRELRDEVVRVYKPRRGYLEKLFTRSGNIVDLGPRVQKLNAQIGLNGPRESRRVVRGP